MIGYRRFLAYVYCFKPHSPTFFLQIIYGLIHSSPSPFYIILPLLLHSAPLPLLFLGAPPSIIKKVHLLRSFNGLICIVYPFRNDIFLVNPLTKSHHKFTETQIPNPLLGFMIFGFRFDIKNNDYKVLRMVE